MAAWLVKTVSYNLNFIYGYLVHYLLYAGGYFSYCYDDCFDQ